jgi:hypothetical protein
MVRYILAATLLTASLALAQEGPTPTQALVAIDSKAPAALSTSNVALKINNKAIPLTSIAPIPPSGAQVAILIDDGLRTSSARQLGDLRDFINNLPAGTEVFVGYMQNGRVISPQAFTTDHAVAAGSLRIPLGSPGISSSPYFALSDFAKRWPASAESTALNDNQQSTARARFVLMITNGVDPYNGSTSISNQNSPYVDAAIRDAQRAGAAVYSIYYSEAGIRGARASFSGQSYLSEVANATGGQSFYEGTGNPVSFSPFLNQFKKAIAETYIATFTAPGTKDFVPIKFSTNLPKTKLRAANEVRTGTRLAAQP